jgi:hypothetical protein
VGEERRVRRQDDDDRAGALRPAGQRDTVSPDPGTDGHAVHRQALAPPVIRLDEHPDHVPVDGHARRRPDPALEAVADHPGAAADVPFRHRPVRRGIDRSEDVLRQHVEAVDVVEETVPRLRDDGQAPRR